MLSDDNKVGSDTLAHCSLSDHAIAHSEISRSSEGFWAQKKKQCWGWQAKPAPGPISISSILTCSLLNLTFAAVHFIHISSVGWTSWNCAIDIITLVKEPDYHSKNSSRSQKFFWLLRALTRWIRLTVSWALRFSKTRMSTETISQHSQLNHYQLQSAEQQPGQSRIPLSGFLYTSQQWCTSTMPFSFTAPA